MYKRRIVVCVSIIMILTLSVLVALNHPPKSIVKELEQPATFVLAEWDYPDEYNQGIYGFTFWENSTGSWVAAPYYTHYYPDYHEEEGQFYFLHSDDDYRLNWSAGVAMKLRVFCTFNNTLVGAIDEADGQNYQRHNITVTASGMGISTVFSQQNFTYYDVTDWYYEYEVILNFLPVSGEIYTITVDYEIFYKPEGSIELDSDTSPTWGGVWEPEGSDGIDDNIFYSLADEDNDEDGAIETGITVSNDLGTVTFNLDLTITAYNKFCTSIDITVMLWSGVGSGSEEIVYSDSLTGTGAVNISGSTSLPIIESFLVNITYVGTVSGDYVNMTIDSYFVGLIPDYDWHTISSPILLFSVSFDMWGYNTGLIILGLVMIPASTLYLAYGVKHDRSNDRLFYGLIIFFVGCGLFIGGIMP